MEKDKTNIQKNKKDYVNKILEKNKNKIEVNIDIKDIGYLIEELRGNLSTTSYEVIKEIEIGIELDNMMMIYIIKEIIIKKKKKPPRKSKKEYSWCKSKEDRWNVQYSKKITK